MPETVAAALRIHEDTARFAAALNVTAATSGFGARLVEKDYFCTVLLHDVVTSEAGLVFKGGTCLSKVHGEFYRLSEDLDFTIPVPVGSSRPSRRAKVRALKQALATLATRVAGVRVRVALTGANQSTQYVATIGYRSVLRRTEETLKLEVGLREPLLLPATQGLAKTLLLDPVSARSLVPDLEVSCLSLDEAMAEKLRAALTRREVAIRDFFDIDYAVQRLGLDPGDPALVGLVRRKLAVQGSSRSGVSAARLEALREQVNAELAPVLRPRDFADFDLDRAWATVAGVAEALA